MEKISYSEAIRISRNFNNRSLDDTKKLYSTIQDAVDLAQEQDGIKSEKAINFLIEVYEPYIKKISGRYYPYVEIPFEFDDVYQEVCVIFLLLTYRYKKEISSFSYYINYMLPQYMNVWMQKINSNNITPIDLKVIESTISHPAFDSEEKVFDYFNGLIFEKEYTAFIIERSKRSSRSNTVKEVCYKIFLGSTTCSELANELGISYHAVYEIIMKIKKELVEFFNENNFGEYIVTSTGEFYKQF